MDRTALIAELAALREREQEIARALDTAEHAAPAEPLLRLAELAARLGCTPKAMRERLRRPLWRWLKDLGDRHADETGRRWLWSEVQAEQQQRRST